MATLPVMARYVTYQAKGTGEIMARNELIGYGT